MSRKILCIEEMIALLDNDDDFDDIDCISIAPPDKVDELTDEECIDEDEIPINDNETALKELAGTFEVELANSSEIEESSTEEPSTQPSETPPMKRAKKTYQSANTFGKPNWSNRSDRSNNFQFGLKPDSDQLVSSRTKLFEEIKNFTSLQLFENFFDQEMFDFIINESNVYAQQKTIQCELDENLLRRFLGILILSGYNTLPSIDDYWSNDPCLGNSIVKQSMSRKKFKDIKRIIHFNNNNNLDKSDKLTKVLKQKLFFKYKRIDIL